MRTTRQARVLMAVLWAFTFICPGFIRGSAAKSDGSSLPVVRPSDASTMRIEGERRFRANCGRCHAAPQKFPPRMMATVLRHMRVRATVTSEDQRLILFYMTQ
jgi:mono/diheme cytochrome c family protein